MRILAAWPTGSRHICEPPVMNTDEDWILLLETIPSRQDMEAEGWAKCEGDDAAPYGVHTQWSAWRKGVVNILVSTDRTWYLEMVAATELARTLNLRNKQDRVSLFKGVKGEEPLSYKKLPGFVQEPRNWADRVLHMRLW